MAILLLVALALGGMYWFTQKDKPATGNGGTGTASNHVQGAGNKKIELTEYGDFQCPACGGYFPILRQIKAQFGDDIKFQFKHFPLDNIHKNARAAHRAAEAAGLQGKFWEMHDQLYAEQQAWSGSVNPVPVFEGYAQQLGLDMEKYKADVQSESTNKTINADIADGQAVKAVSTPTFVINGKKVDDETQQTMRTVEGFAKVLNDEIVKLGGQPTAAPAATGEVTPSAPESTQVPQPTSAPAQ